MRGSALLLAALLLAAPAAAQELRIGMKAAVDGSDPHQSYSPNRNVQLHVYEPLVFQDPQLRPVPGLATAWRPVDETTWEFTLREGVRFHDGTKLTPADVVFSIRRAKDAVGLRTYAPLLRAVTVAEVVDGRTVRLRTRGPAPMLPSGLASVGIVSAAAAVDAGETEFNGGRAAIGTGPYRWVRFSPGASVVLDRMPSHWGTEREPWERVTYRFIPNDSARVAALLAGDVEVIDAVPATLQARVQEDARTRLVADTSAFNFYLFLDTHRERPLHATRIDGQPLDRNPLRDIRVRRAISHALNRPALAERAMQGGAVASNQIAPPGFIGHDPEIPPVAYDPALSRRLLAEAGWPQGFAMTIHCTGDRFPGDARSCQAMGQMLTAVGIKTAVETLPAAIFFRRATNGANGEPEFTASANMFASTTGVAAEGMTSILRTPDLVQGHGASNRGRWSDPALDALLARIEATFDDAAREALMREAARRVMAEAGVLPVFYVKAAWGLQRGLTLVPRGDQYTMATLIRAAP
ncbi:ABC transporter substrate-binding protein [Paracraurococcus ruber]|uniref:Solute-binding protein family 5 domain-containing protein n=1 Tax=Paracraurococcus ruber TaxID=77675 RepID=A0ABS1CXQ0_9PROT|nr:ABC transporter substrate-binding protein [Paracraurococcus ruber]MBK1659086.1 hypothetical protein [Paracraurococcus ruber]TDG32534.1 ABC transporter substrate-binding protein [Paracraurococcus ruber]